MASLARRIPSRLTTRLQGCDGVDHGIGHRLCPPANTDQMNERLLRAAAFLKRELPSLSADIDGPEVSGGDC